MNYGQDTQADPVEMLDARTDYSDGPSQPSDGSSASGLIWSNAQQQTLLSASFLPECVGVPALLVKPALHGAT